LAVASLALAAASAAVVAQDRYSITFTVESRTGECRDSDRLDRPATLWLAPSPIDESGVTIDGYLEVDAEHFFAVHGARTQRLALGSEDDPAGAANQGYLLLGPQPLRQASAVLPRVSGCLVHVQAALEPSPAADAAGDMRLIASRFAVMTLVARAQEEQIAGRLEQAMGVAQAAQQLAETELPAHSPERGRVLIGIATIHWAAGRYDLAAEVGERAVEAMRYARDRRPADKLGATTNLAITYRDAGRSGRAIELLRRGIAEAETDVSADDEDLVQAGANLGLFLFELVLHDQGMPLLERAYLQQTRALGESHWRTLRSREALAHGLSELGLLHEAVPLAEQTRDLNLKVHGPRHPNALYSQVLLARLLLKAGQTDRAVDLLRQARDGLLAALGPRHLSTAGARRQLVEAFMLQRRFDLAQAEVDQLKTLAADWPEAGSTVLVMAREAQVALLEAQQRWQQALDELDAAVEASRRAPDRRALGADRVLQQRGLYLLRLGRNAEAIEVLRSWVEKVEQQRALVGLSEAQRRGALAEGHASYRRLAFAYLQAGRAERAFDVSEMTKARGLVDALATQTALESAGIDGATRTLLTANAARIAKLNESIANPTLDPAARLRLDVERNQLEREAQALHQSLAQRLPRFRALSQVGLVNAGQAAGLLGPRQLAISYMVADGRLFVFVLAPGRPVIAHDLMAVETLRSFAQAFRTLAGAASDAGPVWRRPNGGYAVGHRAPEPDAVRVDDWREVAAAFGHALLAPLRSSLRGVARLYVVPDGPLAEIPFDALMLDTRPLVETTNVVLVQSMSILALMQARPERPIAGRQRILSVGDPVYSGRATLAGASPAIVTRTASDGLAVRRAYDALNPAWPQLPGTRREVLAVKAAFERRAAGRADVSVLLGADASEARLQGLNAARALRGFRYLHFAAHGYLSPDSPELSALVLSQEEPAGASDGYITAAEWLAYELDSELVVMSACETGRGHALPGEGVMGLPYALFVAGNRAAVLTLWKIADDSSARFVTRFFERLAAGVEPSMALTQTKRELLRNRRSAHPLHWAAFVFVGR
jgi:CHAT domain-containing protein/tetratricopeptide (TPR) repeat protein